MQQSFLTKFKKRLRERVFLNCWHASADDSMAMWIMNGRLPTSLAITTTVGKLRDAIQAAKLNYDIAIKKVGYVKYWRDPELAITLIRMCLRIRSKLMNLRKRSA